MIWGMMYYEKQGEEKIKIDIMKGFICERKRGEN